MRRTSTEELPIKRVYRYFTTQPTPALLHTNSEARVIGLQHYQPYFGKTLPKHRYPDNSAPYESHGKWSSRAPPRIWINKQVDRLCPTVGGTELERYTIEVCQMKKEIFRYGLRWKSHDKFDAYYRAGPQLTHAPENSIALELLDFVSSMSTSFSDLLWRGDFFSEILVYSLDKKDRRKLAAYRQDSGKLQPAEIQFRDVDPDDPATEKLRESVDEAREVVHHYLTVQQEQRQRYFVNAARLRGEVYEKKDCGLWKLPTFKAVMIAMDGVVQGSGG